MYIRDSKHRAQLKGLAMQLAPAFAIGKSALTPEFTQAIDESLEANELIKINVLKNCDELPAQLGQMLAERTHAALVQVIGRKLVLYRPARKSAEKAEGAAPHRQAQRSTGAQPKSVVGHGRGSQRKVTAPADSGRAKSARTGSKATGHGSAQTGGKATPSSSAQTGTRRRSESGFSLSRLSGGRKGGSDGRAQTRRRESHGRKTH